jgi:hypothetical protein
MFHRGAKGGGRDAFEGEEEIAQVGLEALQQRHPVIQDGGKILLRNIHEACGR